MPITPDPTAGSGSPNGTELLAFMRPPSTAAAGRRRSPTSAQGSALPGADRTPLPADGGRGHHRRAPACRRPRLGPVDRGGIARARRRRVRDADDALCGDDLGTALLAETIEAIDGTMGDLARANAALLTLRLRLSAGAGEGGRDVR